VRELLLTSRASTTRMSMMKTCLHQMKTSGEHHRRWRRSQTTSILRYPMSSRNTPPQSTTDGMKRLSITPCLLPKTHLPMFIVLSPMAIYLPSLAVTHYCLSPIWFHPLPITHCLLPIAHHPIRTPGLAVSAKLP
jgi:hypothetical protein